MKTKEKARDKCMNFESYSGRKVQQSTVQNLGVTKRNAIKCLS